MSLPQQKWGREICNDFNQASQREWYLSNGLGSYASGTLSGALTRRYHGLLLCPLHHPLDRHLLLSKADATLIIDAQEIPLFSNCWQNGVIAPHGHLHLESFSLQGNLPIWIYSIQGIRLEYRLWMAHDKNAVFVAVRLLDSAGQSVQIKWDILINYRDHHAQMPQNGFDAYCQNPHEDGLIISFAGNPPNSPSLSLLCHGGKFSADKTWINNFYLAKEYERGLAETDNHLRIAQLKVELSDVNQYYGFSASLLRPEEKQQVDSLSTSLKQQINYQKNLLSTAKTVMSKNITPIFETLCINANSFIFKRSMADGHQGYSIIAGYPWFGDWGRDTMISLPGLCLVTGQTDTAKNILLSYSQYVDQGMIPNMFPEAGQDAEYNTVDAALWFFIASFHTVQQTQDRSLLKTLYPVLQQIIQCYEQGTRYGIQMDNDGLIRAGHAGYQLTWMDARIGDWVVTPRDGKAVEINALWYNALMIMAEFSKQLNAQSEARKYQQMAKKTYEGFQQFIHMDKGLFDCLDRPSGNDDSIRPNQLFAIALPWICVEKQQAKIILKVIKQKLLTSYGLRSLSPDHPDYQGSYEGNSYQRDSRYHQGPVWGWLLGYFAYADYRINGDKEKALAILLPLAEQINNTGLGSISEIFDGDPPHHPRGTPSQAWSVASILENWWRINYFQN